MKDNRGGKREGAGRNRLSQKDKKMGCKVYMTKELKEMILDYGNGNSFSEKTVEIIITEINRRKNGIGGYK